MIARIEVLFRRLRRLFSRSEWVVRLLGLPPYEMRPPGPGLILAQVDGLSRSQLQVALERGEMPFLRRLIVREHYTLRTMYAGVPACTPAVQAELFYGVKTAVPAFSFYRRGEGKLRRMYDPESTHEVERELVKRGEPLLKGGAVYSGIFTGGAAESHFCSSSSGWGRIGRGLRPFTWLALALIHFDIVVRTVFLLVVEVVLAITDFFRGVFDGKHFNKELKFIPTRVAICILLRELSTAGVLMDVARGVPVVHVNFIGYDEQAHRRGPTSRFAHWSLKGIDHALRRIWGAAHRSKWRSYDMWIYSDHGQEESVPYEVRHGRPLARALEEWVGEYGEPAVVRNGEKAGHLLRARLLGGRRLQRLLPVHSEFESPPEGKAVRVAHMGPLGHVYWPQPLESEEKERLARRLVDLVKIPLVLTPDGPDRAAAWTEAGRFSLPREAASVLGAGHPFLSEAAEELVRVTHHADAGTFVISGWSPTEKMLNLAVENGSHGGPGTQELEAFALLPVDTPLTSRDGPHVRALDLREAALRHLGRAPKHRHVPGPRAAVRAFRLMSYNVHSCLGMDGVYSPERIARVIARHEPDVVCLQELDMSRPRSGNVDQAALIAQEVRMLWHFHAALHLAEGRYGNAILSPHPMRLVKAGHLPRDPLGRDRETRGALWAAIRFGEVEVQVLNTHLGLFGLERAKQVEALLGSQWTAHPDFREPAVLSGDFNITPRSGSYKIITKTWRDSQLALKGHRPRGTWFGRYPFQRIDYAFVSPSVEVVSVVVPHSHLERVASDHLPLLTELRVHP